MGLCGFLCVTLSDLSLHPRATWYYVVCLVSFWMSLLLIICYAFHVVEKLHFLPWLGMVSENLCIWFVVKKSQIMLYSFFCLDSDTVRHRCIIFGAMAYVITALL